MKKTVPLFLVLLVAFISCSKDVMVPEGIVSKTWKATKLVEIYGKDTITWDIAKNPAVQEKWVVDMWWGNGRGWDLDDEPIGNGVFLRPLVNRYDPESINGPRIEQHFKWYVLRDNITPTFKIGLNTAEIIIITVDSIILHQIDGDVQRWYYLTAVPFGWNMNGKNVNRPG